MSMFISFIFAVVVTWYVLKPIFSESDYVSQPNDEARLQLLADQKSRSVNMLRDLELDYSTGKLSDEEYNSIKEELSYELAEVISKIDKN